MDSSQEPELTNAGRTASLAFAWAFLKHPNDIVPPPWSMCIQFLELPLESHRTKMWSMHLEQQARISTVLSLLFETGKLSRKRISLDAGACFAMSSWRGMNFIQVV